MRLQVIGILAVFFAATAPALAQDLDSTPPNASPQAEQQDLWPHPQLSLDDNWVRKMIWLIALGLFVPAAIIGPWMRKRLEGGLPELHASEEDDGLTASQHEPGHAIRNDEVGTMNDE